MGALGRIGSAGHSRLGFSRHLRPGCKRRSHPPDGFDSPSERPPHWTRTGAWARYESYGWFGSRLEQTSAPQRHPAIRVLPALVVGGYLAIEIGSMDRSGADALMRTRQDGWVPSSKASEQH
jgi:hypothetical protein